MVVQSKLFDDWRPHSMLLRPSQKTTSKKTHPKAPLSLASLEKPARKPPRNQIKTLFLVT